MQFVFIPFSEKYFIALNSVVEKKIGITKNYGRNYQFVQNQACRIKHILKNELNNHIKLKKSQIQELISLGAVVEAHRNLNSILYIPLNSYNLQNAREIELTDVLDLSYKNIFTRIEGEHGFFIDESTPERLRLSSAMVLKKLRKSMHERLSRI